MAAAGEQAPSTEPKMATSEMAQETAITIKDSAKGEKAHFGNYWARKTLPMSVGMLMFRRESSRTEREKIVLRFSLHSSAPSAQAPLYIFYLFIGKFVLTYVSMFCFRTTGLRISANLRLAYIKSLFAQPIKTLDEVSAGTVTNTITTSANTIQMSISDKLHSLFMALALTIAAFSIAFRYSWAMTLVTGSSLLFVLLVYSISTPITLKKLQAVEKANQRAASIAGEIFGSIRAVFSLGAEPALTKKYVSSVDDVHKHGLGLSLQLGIQLSPIWFAMYSAFALAFWFGLKLFREGHIGSISTVIIVFFSVLIVVGVLGVMVAPIMAITKAISSSTEFFSMIDSPKISYEGMGESDVSSHEDIELRDVSFTYPSRPHVPVLSGFDATFLKGKTTALVGPSGAGKSSIVSLLERWYELEPREAQLGEDELANEHSQGRNSASEAEDGDKAEKLPSLVRGTISIGGHNIRDINLKWWRSQIGLVQQEPFLFSDTILSNVSFGLLGTQWENETDVLKRQRVEKACKEAFADEFINQLPDGYLTQVGESGIKLSGGQRQRLAIARSIVREPAILILDEATSSIDVRGERIVQQALERVSQNRTTIVIAHRLSTIRKADNIVVIRHGQKIEEGTHEHLLKIPDGLYASLVRAQQLEAESAPGLTDSDDGSGVAIERKETSGSMKQKPEEVTIAYKRTGFFGSLGRFLFEQRKHWKLYILIVAAAMGAGSAFSLQSWIFAKLIEVFRFTGTRLKNQGDFWSLMFFILALCVGFCYFILGFTSNHLSVYVATAYRLEYFRNILRNPIPFFDREGNASGSLMGRLSTDPKVIQDLLGLNGVFPLIAFFNITGCIAIAFSFGWKLTLVAFFSAMPVILVAAMVRIRFDLQFEKYNSDVFSHSSQFATEAIGAFRTVTSLTMEDTIINKYSDLLRDQIRKSTLKATYASLVFALSDSIELCAMALTFWYGGQLLASREYNPVQFFVIYIAVVQGAQGAGQFFSFAPDIANATAAANRILGIRHEVAERGKAVTGGQPLPHSNVNAGAKVEFKGVTFQYPTRDTPIYRNLNISIQGGQFVAFVGPSGCGKTTVVSLLERFYEPLSGTITFNDQDVKDIELTSYRRALSLVAQEPKLFDGTIRENLVLGLQLDDATSEEKIVQACKDAEIHDFIVSLPEGYATPLGINTQTSLSGGQKQRLCLARALLREPMLLLLDEATSSLDSQSEKLVQAAIEKLVGQRSMTVVAVAHRLATIQKADVIFVFSESEVGSGSRVVEQGTHHDLLRRRGAYWQMCQEQALDR
ncbi:hypothetical protein LTR96_006888 [Exophiala xenobiotica]|uniref:Uncharacterized protein n=1 Tax=Vermiconidia calcicola TaxID=1690605 RepID=A0AAV9PRT1_9PEZI|nr:hypothetical protein LTR96_006888 [Exophiala xenobiotica]KAK5528105.1 hypothetical protein LTR25_010620 [Vermiconidia calcicola]KAK5533656.1 hypothetical protein LTR23_009137 [Chaetothyriales sp. CCFEE 6169]KAK5285372.1 hypothetical protein LTR14_011007 [Exophiala xenobiotica]KAK5345210.1 hypothetical protein LTR61_011020 [Exophiala xenobiotica]